MSTEREVKLEVGDAFELPNLEAVAGVRADDRGVRVLDATYWDSPNLDLLRAGYGLRHRTTDGADGTWTLKAESTASGAALVREETEVPGSPEQPPQQLLTHLPAALRGLALEPVATLQTRRHVVDLLDGDGSRWAELADDRVAVLDRGTTVSTFREVEVELAGDTDEERAGAVVDALRAAGAVAPGVTAKYVRALRALGWDVPA